MILSEAEYDSNSIFISTKLSPLSPLSIELNSLGYEVIDEALIKFDQIRFTHTPSTQWIFFSSRTSIYYFFAQNPELSKGIKFGVMNQVSANYLTEYNKKADFIGSGVNVTLIAKEFAKAVKDESVLFPEAMDSLQTIQRQLSFTNSCHNLFVYKTSIRKDINLKSAAILVFTSPSNVQAYFEKYKLVKGQKVVANGSTTFDRLRDYGVKDISLSNSFDDMGILNAIKELLATSNNASISKKIS